MLSELANILVFVSDVDATVNYEISNGHTIVITEEAIQEENVKTVEDNGSLSAKAAVSEEKKEDKKGILNAMYQNEYAHLKITITQCIL